MSHLKSEHSGKSVTTSSPTIAFRFRSGDDELEELQIEDHDSSFEAAASSTKGSDLDSSLLKVDEDKSESTSETTPVKEYWNLLGKRSTSVDSGCESPFPNSDPWRKFNELKGKLTKTVEEKISEMKIERNKSGNVLGISSRGRLVNSKDNSSISDSEDTSESSRLSESLKESEENASPKKTRHQRSDTIASLFDTVLENIKTEVVETEPDEKNRISDVVKLSEIKISTAKAEMSENPNIGEVESGIEADENFISERQGESPDRPDLPDLGEFGLNSSGNQPSPQIVRRWPPPFENLTIHYLASILIAKKTELLILIAAMILYHVFPMSPFFKGLFTGILLMIAGNYILNYFINFGFKMKDDYVPDGAFKIPVYEMLKPLLVPRQAAAKGVWFNEYMKEYDPDMYSVTQTVPVYLEVNDCYLKLSRPKGKINKRATYDEPEYKLVFVNTRVYNISNCTVVLHPDGLTKKRLYSKKYPIVVMLKPDSLVTDKVKDKDFVEAAVDDEETDQDNTETDDTLSQSHESAYGRLYLNLFARCDRQKEEWYRKILAATKFKVSPDKPEKQNWAVNLENDESGSNIGDESWSNEPSTPFESVYFDEEEAKYEEYLRYMTQFVEFQIPRPLVFPLKAIKGHVSLFKRLLRKKRASVHVFHGQPPQIVQAPPLKGPRKLSASKSCPIKSTPPLIEEEAAPPDDTAQNAQQTQWFNAFVNRVLFDVFRSPYWLEQIRTKMEKKLNSIRMPFYVEDIEIVELDLGKMGPRFHRISPPLLDDRGLWFDMDLTFDGLVKVTIQTQLNLIKLQKGMDQQEETLDEPLPAPPIIPEKPRSPMYDSELEDSAESSEEEEDDDDETSQSSTVDGASESVSTPQKRLVPTRKSSKKLFRIFENVAQSKYFKSVAQSKYIQRAIAGVSRTKLKLSLEIKGCVGTIAVNIPPPPSDRLWYGFREMPKVWLSAQPKIGEKHVRISHVKNFLEKKIMQEFKKVMVFPNMDDVILPTYPQVFNQNPNPTPTPTSQAAYPIVPDLVTTPPLDEINQT